MTWWPGDVVTWLGLVHGTASLCVVALFLHVLLLFSKLLEPHMSGRSGTGRSKSMLTAESTELWWEKVAEGDTMIDKIDLLQLVNTKRLRFSAPA